MGMAVTALLFIDVDGPLNPYDRSPCDAWEAGYARITGYHVHLHASHGPALRALPYTLVWATTWGSTANRQFSPRLGLPELPVVEFDTPEVDEDLYFKTPAIVEYAAGRPFAWIDDEITDADREWVATRHEGPALLHWVDPAVGLVDADFDVLAAWAGTLAPAT